MDRRERGGEARTTGEGRIIDGEALPAPEAAQADPGAGERSNGQRRTVYCLIPAELADQLHDPLRRHFREDARIEVVVESRRAERRGTSDRRATAGGASRAVPASGERRRIRAAAGRRIAERRAPVATLDEPPPLPRRARRHADRIAFFVRLEPSTQQLEDQDTARLVARFQTGEQDVFAELYVRYFDRVYSYLRSMLRDPHEAEDLTQQTFIALLEALPSYERRRQPFRGWLFILVRNIAISHLRKHNRIELEDPQAQRLRRESAVADEQISLGWLSDRDLHVLVERLPPVQRQVLLLRYLLDLPAAEVGEILGRSPVQVRKLQQRAIAFLRERLTALGRAPERRAPRSGWRRRTTQVRVLRERRFALLR